MTSLALAFDILARDKGASETFGKIGDSAEHAEGRVKSAFKKMGGAAKLGGAAAGAAAGAALTAGLFDALDREASNAKLGAQLGLSPGDLKQLGKVSGGIYADNFGESIGGIDDALRLVVNNIGLDINSVSLKPITEQVLALTDVFDQDLGGVTRATGQLLKTGLADNAQQALDIVARGFQIGADKSDDFLDTLNEYGTQFRKLGIDGADATGLIAQGLKAGARDGDLVADAIKEFSIRAIDGSKTTADAFHGIGLRAKDMTAAIAKGGPTSRAALQDILVRLRGIKDPAKQAAIATGLFGTQAEDLGQALFSLDLDKASNQMGDFDGAAQRASDTVGGTATATLETFKRKLQTAIVDTLGTEVIPRIEDFVTGMQDGTGAGGDFADIVGDIGDASKVVLDTLLPIGRFVIEHPDLFTSVAIGAAGLGAALKVQAIYGGIVARFMPGLAVATAAEGTAAAGATVGVASLATALRGAAGGALLLLPALVNVRQEADRFDDFIDKYGDRLGYKPKNTSTYAPVPGAGRKGQADLRALRPNSSRSEDRAIHIYLDGKEIGQAASSRTGAEAGRISRGGFQ